MSVYDPSENLDDYINTSRQVQEHTLASFPEQLQAETTDTPVELSLGATTLRFVFWTHVSENQKHVIPLLEGCHVIAREGTLSKVYTSEKRRQRMAAAFERSDERDTKVMSQPKGLAKQARLKYRNWALKLTNDKEHLEIMRHFVGSLEATKRLDIGPMEAPEYQRLEANAKELEDKSYEAFQTFDSWGGLSARVLRGAKAHAKSLEFRETVAQHQIEKLVADYPGRTIGVLYGEGHHLLTRLIKVNDVALQRQFAQNEEYVEPQKLAYSSAYSVLVDAMRTGVSHPVLELNRCMVQSLALRYGNKDVQQKIISLDETSLNSLVTHLQALWKEPIYNEQTGSQEAAELRKTATAALLASYVQ
jgi:hypothetical protein